MFTGRLVAAARRFIAAIIAAARCSIAAARCLDCADLLQRLIVAFKRDDLLRRRIGTNCHRDLSRAMNTRKIP